MVAITCFNLAFGILPDMFLVKMCSSRTFFGLFLAFSETSNFRSVECEFSALLRFHECIMKIFSPILRFHECGISHFRTFFEISRVWNEDFSAVFEISRVGNEDFSAEFVISRVWNEDFSADFEIHEPKKVKLNIN